MKIESGKIYRGEFKVSVLFGETRFDGFLIFANNKFQVTIDFKNIRFQLETIDIIHGKLNLSRLSIKLINCTILKSESTEFTFEVEELFYSSDEKVLSEKLTKLSYNIIGLDYFLKERVFDYKTYKEGSISFKTKKTINLRIFQDSSTKINLKKFAGIKLSHYNAEVYEIYTIEIIKIKKTLKQIVFNEALKVKYFFSLFSFDIFPTGNMTFFTPESEIYCITDGFPHLEVDRPILFPLLQLKVLNKPLSEIYSFISGNDRIFKLIQLIKGSSKSLNYIDVFLNFSRVIESFSRSFLQEEEMANWKSKEERQLFLTWTGIKENKSDKVGQLLHLFKSIHYLEDTLIHKELFNKKDFLLHLNGTRNYYTHLNPSTKYVWSNNQIKEINPYLKLFGILLIWKFTDLDTKAIDKGYNLAKGFIKHHSLDENPHSVYFNKSLNSGNKDPT